MSAPILPKAMSSITWEEIMDIRAQQQQTEGWLDARKNRITASMFGAAAGHNPYCSPKQCAKSMLWKTFKGNNATRWGNGHEKEALKRYVDYVKSQPSTKSVEVLDSGLHVRFQKPYMGGSPDGIVYLVHTNGVVEWRLLEIKCPYSKRNYLGIKRFYEPLIPHYYYDQIQGIMGILNENKEYSIKSADFVVWTPLGIRVSNHSFDFLYWKVLDETLEKFYLETFLPSYCLREQGKLYHGDLEERVLCQIAPIAVRAQAQTSSQKPATLTNTFR